jgi:hypothetical protein
MAASATWYGVQVRTGSSSSSSRRSSFFNMHLTAGTVHRSAADPLLMLVLRPLAAA